MNMNFKKALGALALTVAVTAPVHAIPLSTLFDGQSIQAGDKLFGSWRLLGYDTSIVDRTFNAANIEVTALADGGLDPGPGLAFSVLDGELSVTGSDDFEYIDLMFGFEVSVLAPTLFVKDVSLSSSGALSGPNSGGDRGYFIGEFLDANELFDFSDPPDPDLGAMENELSRNPDGDLTENQSASADFAPRKSLFVTKNLLVFATAADESATLFGFEQRFSQIERTVPEPSTLALALLALGGAGFSRRLRRQ